MGKINPISFEDGKLILLDQRKLPHLTEYVEHEKPGQVKESIRNMTVRGAPAIGVTAAYGMVLSAQSCNLSDCNGILEKMKSDGQILKEARPTAVNLAWAVDRILDKASKLEKSDPDAFKNSILKEAVEIHKADIAANRKIGEYALELLKDSKNILTHCNAGILATTEYGTATSVFYVGREKGIDFNVYADETRPRLQGAMLTAYELHQNGISVTVICDNAAAHLMSKGEIDAVITGADRIAANGDTANKIGTLGVSIAAAYYGIPFYIAAPVSTIDFKLDDGSGIPIEERDGEEVSNISGIRIMPEGVSARNPAFDVTPAKNISAIITEKGILRPPFIKSIAGIH